MEKLLSAEFLPPFAIREHLETFWVLEQGAEVLGCAGIEVYPPAALLRSVVVAPSLRGTGKGERLTREALGEAKERGAERAYLFTLHAVPFFARFGFQECTMEDFEPGARRCSQYVILQDHPEIAGVLKAMRLELP
jgi:N-acetylglutamate synthase-like GNAT family acetyltransferase